MQIKQMLKVSELIVWASLLQSERLWTVSEYDKYAEGEQTFANVVTGITGVIALHTVSKAFNFATSYLKMFVSISLPLCILPSAIFHVLDYLEIKDNRCYKVIKYMHNYMDQVGSLAMLVSQLGFLYLGAPLFSYVGLGILATIVGFACSSVSGYYHRVNQEAEQTRIYGSNFRPSSFNYA